MPVKYSLYPISFLKCPETQGLEMIKQKILFYCIIHLFIIYIRDKFQAIIYLCAIHFFLSELCSIDNKENKRLRIGSGRTKLERKNSFYY